MKMKMMAMALVVMVVSGMTVAAYAVATSPAQQLQTQRLKTMQPVQVAPLCTLTLLNNGQRVSDRRGHEFYISGTVPSQGIVSIKVVGAGQEIGVGLSNDLPYVSSVSLANIGINRILLKELVMGQYIVIQLISDDCAQ